MEGLTKEMVFGTQKKKNDVPSPIINEKTDEDRIVMIDTDKLVAYRGEQPIKYYSESDYQQLKESIARVGILNPIIVRKIEDDKFEIFSGHNRLKVAKELGINLIPARIRNVDDEHAKLIMIDTNLCQRQDIPLSEKGEAYKMKLETLKKIRENEVAHDEQGASVEIIAKDSGDSRATIQRLIRITELIKPLQLKVNKQEQISLLAGVELSHISPEEQEIINKVLDDNNLKISVEQAENLRAIKGTITEQSVYEVFKPKEKVITVKFTGKLSKSTFEKYKEKFASNEEFDEVVDRLLQDYFDLKVG